MSGTRSTADVLGTVESLIERYKLDRDGERRSVYRRLVGEAMHSAINRSPTEALLYAEWMPKLVRDLSVQQYSDLADVLAKWVAYAHDRQLVRKDCDWQAGKLGEYALPSNPYEPLPVKDIIHRVYSHVRFSLPSRDELAAVSEPEKGVLELVRDGFPGRHPGKELFPSAYHIWSCEGEPDFVDRGRFDSDKFAWRPRFDLSGK